MRVIDLARRANVTPDSVRHYTRHGLLVPSRNPRSGYKIFNENDFVRLLFIKDARALGLSVAEIKSILAQMEGVVIVPPDIRRLFAIKLTELRKRIDTLRALESRVSKFEYPTRS